MKILFVAIFLFSVVSSTHAENNENVADKTLLSEVIPPNSLVPKRTTKRSAYGYGLSPYGYGDYYGFGYPYRNYFSSPYRIGYPYYSLYGGYGSYGYYGW